MTEKVRKELKESEIGYYVNAMVDPSVSQEEINNSTPHSLLGAGLKDVAIDFKNLTGGNQSLSNVLAELDKKADKDDIVDPRWGQITGDLLSQTDLKSALIGKASISDLAAVDTRTRNLESSKANADDVTSALASKADKTELDSKANADDVTSALASKADKTELDSKASAILWDDIEIPAGGWSSSTPYTQTVTVTGMTATFNPDVDIKFTNNTTIETEKAYYNCVDQITTGTNSITLVCSSEKPAGTFHIKMKEVS